MSNESIVVAWPPIEPHVGYLLKSIHEMRGLEKQGWVARPILVNEMF